MAFLLNAMRPKRSLGFGIFQGQRRSATGSFKTVRIRAFRYRQRTTIAAPRRLAGLKFAIAIFAFYAYLLQSFILGLTGSAAASVGEPSPGILCGIHMETDLSPSQTPDGTPALNHDCCLAANGAASVWSLPVPTAVTMPFRLTTLLSDSFLTPQRTATHPDDTPFSARAPPSSVV